MTDEFFKELSLIESDQIETLSGLKSARMDAQSILNCEKREQAGFIALKKIEKRMKSAMADNQAYVGNSDLLIRCFQLQLAILKELRKQKAAFIVADLKTPKIAKRYIDTLKNRLRIRQHSFKDEDHDDLVYLILLAEQRLQQLQKNISC